MPSNLSRTTQLGGVRVSFNCRSNQSHSWPADLHSSPWEVVGGCGEWLEKPEDGAGHGAFGGYFPKCTLPGHS